MPGRGIVWERVCNNSRDRLCQDGDLSWCRMNPPVLKIGPGHPRKRGSFLAVRTGKGPPDWIALHKGLSIIGDDKDCRNGSWATTNIKTHQVKAFNQHEEQNGVACILLRMPDKSRWVIPWKVLKPLREKNATISLSRLEEIGAKRWVIKDPNEPAYDWLNPLLEVIDGHVS
jgi:penicillin-binding protein-related factor A (putative recombinase)|tara:strand:+ start:276 stop:791 length:516 start_codon:yes stop_codon:yes gene_type:complete